MEPNNAYVGCHNKQVIITRHLDRVRIIHGEERHTQSHTLSTTQIKKCVHKRCKLFYALVIENTQIHNNDPTSHLFIKEVKDVFPLEIKGLPPKRVMEHAIDLYYEQD